MAQTLREDRRHQGRITDSKHKDEVGFISWSWEAAERHYVPTAAVAVRAKRA
jgi:hypothetical protein